MELNIENMKILSKEIIQEESKRINKNIKFYPITVKEYYKNYIFEQKDKKINKINILTQPSKSSGFNDPKGNIIILLDKVNKITPEERKLFALVLYCYHEARHTEQKNFSKYSYINFLTDIEIYLIGEKKLNYKQNHNKFSFEIDANHYAIKKTKEYLIEKYPDVYNIVEKEISDLENDYNINQIEYDAVNIVEKIIDFMRYKLLINFAETVSSMEIISPVLKIFLFPDTTFKSIKMMKQDEHFKQLDKRIIYAFLSTKQFLDSTNIDNLTYEELLLLNESLEYTNNIYLNQKKMSTSNNNEKLKENLKLQKNILKRISSKKQLIKEDKNKKERIKNISTSLELTRKKLVKK